MMSQTFYAATEEEQASLSDVSGNWAETQINDWVSKGLAKGDLNDTFRPNHTITWAEFFALVNRAFGYTKTKTVPNKFSDVLETDWFSGDIAKAVAIGYVSGYADGTIKPENPISRQEVAAILSKIFMLTSENLDHLNGFTDKRQIPQWSQSAITSVVGKGYLKGYPDGRFQPRKSITRAEAIAVLDRATDSLYNKPDRKSVV